MLKRFLDFIKNNQLISKGDKTLLAVSGGIDSVVLTILFKEAGFDFAIAHCNFQLRAEESDTDETFVKALAKSLGVKYFVHSFDTKNYAALHNISTQMAARDLRYSWFKELAGSNNFNAIATAHHLDDSFETALFNLAKGTGISGLRGMLPKKENIIRPLLYATKDDIVKYATEKRLQWREDSSNESVKYSRNLIRHKVMPVLKLINPSLEDTFRQTQQRLYETEVVLKNEVERIRNQNIQIKGSDAFISIEALRGVQAVVIEELLKPFGFNFSQVQELLVLIKKTASGKVLESEEYLLNVDREEIIISPLNADITERLINQDTKEVHNEVVKITTEIVTARKILTKETEASLDFDLLKFPLKLRKWKQGDVFQPLGMRGKKKISDFMIDEKIPLNLKQRVCVIESEGEVVWIVGHRIDDRFKVHHNSKKIYNVVMHRND